HHLFAGWRHRSSGARTGRYRPCQQSIRRDRGAIEAAWRPLSNPFKAQVLSLLTDRGSSLTSSMYRDMKGGYSVEADQIIGDLVVRATEKGIATPLLSAALTRLRIYEEIQRGRSGR